MDTSAKKHAPETESQDTDLVQFDDEQLTVLHAEPLDEDGNPDWDKRTKGWLLGTELKVGKPLTLTQLPENEKSAVLHTTNIQHITRRGIHELLVQTQNNKYVVNVKHGKMVA